MVYFLTLSVGSLVIGLLVTLPDVYRDHPPATLRNRRLLGLYVFAVLMLNYALLRRRSRLSRVLSGGGGGGGRGAEEFSGGAGLPRLAAGAEGSALCRDCGVLAPPRAKHCPLCATCVLKRDHHCFFGGCCVGFHNQRYFIAFCLYGALGSLYSGLLTFTYLGAHYVSVLGARCYAYLPPWLLWRWVSGQTDIGVVAMVLFSYFSVFTFLACFGFFGFQCFLLARGGQTSYEYAKGVGRYRCSSLGESLRSVFGPFWFLSLLVPLPFLKSPDNGVDWKVVHEFKQM